MHRKGNNYEEYKIRKKQFQEPEQSEDGDIPYQRDLHQNRNVNRQRKEPEGNFKKGRQSDNWSFGLMDMVKQGGLPKASIKSTFNNQRLEDKKPKNSQLNNTARVNQPQFAQTKQRLDKQLLDYRQGVSKASSVRDKSLRGSQISKDDESNADWSEDLSIPMKGPEYKTSNNFKNGTNPVNKKEKEVPPGQDSSDWLNNGQEESITSDLNIQKILNESDFPVIDTEDKSKQPKKQEQLSLNQKKIDVKRDPSTGANKEESISVNQSSEAKILNSFSLYGTQGQDSLNNGHLKTSQNFPSHLLNEQVFQNEVHIVEAKKEEEPRMPEDQLKRLIQNFYKDGWLKVSLTFEVYDNIFELKIKEVELVKLGVVVKISSNNGKISLLKYPDISHQQIENCISFIDTAHSFPRMLSNLPEDIPNAVEGDQQFEPAKHCSKTDLQFCKVRGVEPEQEKGKIDKSVVMLRSVEVSCMECMAVNKIMVVQSNNAVMGSCRSCSTKIEGRIVSLRLTSE